MKSAASVALLAGASTGTAFAQGAPQALSEVVVTANKREQAIDKVDGGVSVVTADQLRDNDVRTVDDLQKVFPGVTIENRGNRAYANFTVRGVSSPDFYNPSVQVYVDGVPQAASAMVQDLTNVERVELLRGPQGTLYGRNAFGGVLNIITRKPRDNGATVFGTAADRRLEAGFAATGAIVPDTLFLDMSVKALEQIGQLKDSNGSNNAIDGSKAFNGRIGLRYAPTGGPFDANTWVSHDSLTSFEETAVLDADVKDRIYRSTILAFPYNRIDREITTAGLNWNYRFGEFTLSSTTSYQTVDLKRRLFGFQFPETTNTFNQEIKLAYDGGGRLKAVGGIAYLNETFTRDSFVSLPNASRNRINSESVAVFGEATYALTERLDITAGARGAYDRSKIDFAGAMFGFDNSAQFRSFQPKVSLGYQLTDQTRLYALVSQGYKPGGFNHAVSFPDDALAYQPETAWNYEVGSRSSLWDGRLMLSAAVYYITSKNKQIYVGPIGVQVIRNAGEAESTGVELEATLKPTDRLTLAANAAFGRSEFTNFIDPLSGVNYNGKQVPYAPDATANLFGRYVIDQRLVPAEVALTGAAHFVSTVYFDEANTMGQGGYGTYDVGLEFALPKGPTFKVFAQNVTDVVYRTNSFMFSGAKLSTIGQGRLVGVSGRIAF